MCNGLCLQHQRVSRTVDVLFCLYNWSWLGLGFPVEHLINALMMLNYQPKNSLVSCDLEGEIEGAGGGKHGPEKGKKKEQRKRKGIVQKMCFNCDTGHNPLNCSMVGSC